MRLNRGGACSWAGMPPVCYGGKGKHPVALQSQQSKQHLCGSAAVLQAAAYMGANDRFEIIK